MSSFITFSQTARLTAIIAIKLSRSARRLLSNTGSLTRLAQLTCTPISVTSSASSVPFNILKCFLDLMNLRYVLEVVTNTPFDELMKNEFTGPLGMTRTYFNKGNKHMHDGIAPTEYQTELKGRAAPNRPQPIWGMVCSSVRWLARSVLINGSTGRYMMRTDGVSMVYQGTPESFLQRTTSRYSVRWASTEPRTRHTKTTCAQMILNKGTYGDVQILKPSTVELIFTNFNTKFPEHSHGLGFELDQYSWAGPMASLDCAGHTGFAGTCMAIDRGMSC